MWDADAVADAAVFLASFNPKAVAAGGEVLVDVSGGETAKVRVRPTRQTGLAWREPTWEELRAGKRERFTICGEARDKSRG